MESEASYESPMSMTTILHALSKIKVTGSFAAFSKVSEVPPAGLHVNGIGDIEMPLGESQARQLIAMARQAPYGKKNETLVDTSVRNTWELDASQFTFRNARWPAFMKTMNKFVAKALGINKPIKAEMYKMLLYEEGAMFKVHTDTEKIPGMFGTLVISLPSVHEGGEVVLKHCGRAVTYRSSLFEQSCACWYSDVSHEVLPVISGYRWVLTYNLAAGSTALRRPSAGLQCNKLIADFESIIAQWASDGQSAQTFYHVLEHQYTENNIRLNALKGHDLAQVQALSKCSKGNPFEVFLALLEKEDYVDDKDYYYHDYTGSAYRVRKLVDLDGCEVAENLDLDQSKILQDDAFKDIKMDEQEEYIAGNEGSGMTKWYRLTAVAVTPHDALPDLFMSNKPYNYAHPWNASLTRQTLL